jgi:ribosome-binding protein aMBF1 (putative translation factor)
MADELTDDLDAYVAARAGLDPEFPAKVEAEVARQELMHRLGELRRAAGLSRAQVAARMGTSEAAVVRLERGSRDVRLSSIQRFAEALGAQLEMRVRRAG